MNRNLHAHIRQVKGINSMADKFAGKVAVITGASSGIGLATAKRLLEEGMDHVFITGRRKHALDAAVDKIGTNVTAVEGDVSRLGDLDRLYDAVEKKNRTIDVIFENPGIAQLAPLESVDEEFFDKHFDANVKGLFFTVQKGLPLMNDGGAIVLNASIATIKAFSSMGIYSATKAAVRSLARTWTIELRDRRIRVNAISPGHIDTPIFETWEKGDALTKMKEDLACYPPGCSPA
jgi:NAD(P)-dependent dehydrogenase (short-subunit alcohol dehydrogenase family)